MPKHSFITELIWSARLICLTAQRIAEHDCFNPVLQPICWNAFVRTETSATLLTANVNKLLITRHEHAAQGQKSRSGAFCLIYKQIKRRHSKDLKFWLHPESGQKRTPIVHTVMKLLIGDTTASSAKPEFFRLAAAAFVDTSLRRC